MLTPHNKRQHKHEQYEKHKNIPRMKPLQKVLRYMKLEYIEASNDHLTTIQIYEKKQRQVPH